MKSRCVLVLVVLAFLLSGCASTSNSLASGGAGAVPANIILLIGDGMGVSQVTAAKTVKGRLNMERFNTAGFLTTYSDSHYVTDSAASGTAMATGRKTYNGAISVSPDKVPMKTALEWAEDEGKSTGIVVTCFVMHATPAAFLAHVDKRDKYPLIAEQIADSGVDVLFGGGLGYLIPKSEKDSKRKDEKNLLPKIEARMQVATTAEEFNRLRTNGAAAAFLATEHLPKVAKREVTLAQMTEKALKILSRNKKGFFMMVEGSQIDWGGHNNDPNYIITETVDFDDAVGVALDFALKDKNTLVIVTADHETGGFAVLDGSISEKKVTKTKFATTGHSGTMVPLFAAGPGCEVFGGIHDNTMIGKTLIQYIKASKAKAE